MEPIDIKLEGRICTLTLTRPEKRNALSPALIEALTHALAQAANDPQVKVLMLKSEGKVFSAGADLAYLQSLQNNSFQENLQDSNKLRKMFELLYAFPKPTIAVVQGDAIAGGCGLATLCDFVYAESEARFGYTEVKIGFLPALVMVFLVEKIGMGNAKTLLLGGELISAFDARRLGLVTEVYADVDTLNKEANKLASRLVSTNSDSSMQMTKAMFAQVGKMNLSDGLDYAEQMNAQARATEDCKKGIAAFLNKQKILWT